MNAVFAIFLVHYYVSHVLAIPLNETVGEPVARLTEVCAQCKCSSHDVVSCRVNPTTGCYCVRGMYRLGEDGKCMERALCERRF